MTANLSGEIRSDLLQSMLKIRELEERIVHYYPEQEMRCPVHLSIGQEATAAGMCAVLKPTDIIFGNHRSHAHYVAKGGNLRQMVAEMYGKQEGCSKGIGGSMHLIDLPAGIVATTPIVGSTIPVAVGAALANKMLGNGIITTLFIGDGATEEGVFHESLSFAILKRLPIIFFCENNFYSVYTHLRSRQPERKISDMVAGHGVETDFIDGNDAGAVYQSAAKAYDKVKQGYGPAFIEAVTYRWREHCGPGYDNHIGYRSEREFEEWKIKCPINRLTESLLAEGVIDGAWLKEKKERIATEVEDAFQFAKSKPFPPESQLFENIYAE